MICLASCDATRVWQLKSCEDLALWVSIEHRIEIRNIRRTQGFKPNKPIFELPKFHLDTDQFRMRTRTNTIPSTDNLLK